jgi:hypothetical protein
MYFIFWAAVRLSRKDGAGWGRGRVSCGGWRVPIINSAYVEEAEIINSASVER